MSKKQIIIFAVVSIGLLAGVFLISALSFMSETGNNTGLAGMEQGEYEFKLSDADPLITPASKIYLSFLDEDDPVRGDKEAEIVIMEFGDFECPYCAALHDDLGQIVEDYNGKVKLVWKDFPNPVHLQAKTAALAARCAQEQGGFWQYHDYLFANQEYLSRETYNQIALEIGLNLVEFNSCLDSRKYIEVVGRGLSEGQEMNVDATPYLFIGNNRFDYALDYDEINRIIDKELGI